MTNRAVAAARKIPGTCPGALILFCAIFFQASRSVDAYDVVGPAIEENKSAVAFQNAEPSARNEAIPEEPLPVAEGPSPSVEIRGGENAISSAPRRFQYMLRLTMRGVYDDNINLSQSNPVSDYYFAIEPAIAAGFGDLISRQENYIRLDYVPSIFIFADHSSNNAVQHLIKVEGQYRFSRLSVTMSQDIEILNGANLPSTNTTGGINNGVNFDVSGRTRVNVYNTKLAASYDLTGKTFLSGGLYATIYDYTSLISSESVGGNIFLNYNYSPKVVLGLGGTAGYNWVQSPNPKQSFEQVNFRASYQATGKISLNASVGIEFRQFENDSSGSHISPVYELGATYQPFDGTSITLSGTRRTLNSAVLAAQDFASTNITFGVRQRLLQRMYLGLTGGYENSDYFSTVNGLDAARQDNYYFIEPSLDVIVTRWLTAGIYYLHRQDDSSLENFSFHDNQVGLRASIAF